MSSTQQLLLGEGAGGGGPVTYIEDVFSTSLWNGNSSTQTITNGINLSANGGMVWIKQRNVARNHYLFDTVRGASEPYLSLSSNLTDSQTTNTGGFTDTLTSFNTNGFSLGARNRVNDSAGTYVGWTFQEKAKFFDIVTYTGNGTAGRTIAHNLGSVPGCIIVKCISTSALWAVYHRSLTSASYYMALNSTAAQSINTGYWNGTAPTSSVFTLGNDGDVNGNGQTYVAYIFAHDAGGFGAAGTDNVISCGSFTWNNTPTSVTLGYEPQWILYRQLSGNDAWRISDTMRNDSITSQTYVQTNSTATDATDTGLLYPTATGFAATGGGGAQTNIYIAIRRGPMKVPTSGTSVFTPSYFTGDDSTSRQLTAGFVTDTFLGKRSIGDTSPFVNRLRGKDLQLYTSLTNAEATSSLYCRFDSNTGPIVGYNAAGGININSSAYTYRTYSFGRAPSFHDVVCYTGNASARTIDHNLAAVPELMIVKSRSAAGYWPVYAAAIGNDYILSLDTNAPKDGPGAPQWNSTTPTSSVFSLGNSTGANANGVTFVAYLFATCAGVSKVGSYTGNGGSQTINCGFTSGARFVLIKKSSGTGNWNLWDSARGIVSGNDPYFALNSSDGEVTSNDSVDTNSTGFVVNEVAATNANESGATYIFLAIA